MATNITYPNYPQNQTYAQPSDVLSLLGAISFSTPASGAAFLNTVLVRGMRYIDSQTGRKFGPTRYIEEYDGSGSASLILNNAPIISLNYVKNYVAPQLLSKTQGDYSLVIDRDAGIVRTPPTLIANYAAQYFYVFYKGNKNVQADYWAGFTLEIYGEQLTTTNNVTYACANGNFAKTYVQQFGPIQSTPPVYRPVVYLNGTQLINTTYEYNANQTLDNYYQVNQDNIYYTVNYADGSITFNTPNQPTDVVTCDYSFWYVPEDIQDACAKFAAIEVLKTEGIGLGGALGQGAALRQIENVKIQYGRNSTLPWEAIVDIWKADIQAVIDKYTRTGPMMKNSYYSGGPPMFGW